MSQRIAGLSAILLTAAGLLLASEAAAYSCHLTGDDEQGRRILTIRSSSWDTYDSLRITQKQRGFIVRSEYADDPQHLFSDFPSDPQGIGCEDLGEVSSRTVRRIDLVLGRRASGVTVDLAAARPGDGLAPGPAAGREATTIKIRGGPDPINPRGFVALRATNRANEIIAGMRGGKPAIRYEDTKSGDRRWIRGLAVGNLYLGGAAGNDLITGKGKKGVMSDLSDWVKLDIDGGHGADLLVGHDGVDAIYGGTGRDRIYGGYGNDRQTYTREWARYGLSGGPGSDVIFGGPGNDEIGDWGPYFLDIGRDRIFAGPGQDKLLVYKDGDRDLLDCGRGRDEYSRIDRDLDRLKGCEGRTG